MEALGLTRNLGPFSNVHKGFQNILMRTFMFGVVGSLAMFISSWEKTDRMRDQLFDTHRDYGDTFDFIIVGGGTAGALVAKRLSEHYRVLLLEAGGDPHPFQSIPMFSSYMLNYKELDWMHTTVPQKRACLNCENKQVGISQGKSLGGTTNLNFMHHARGSPLDYDNWANLIGDPSWTYENLLPYFKKYEEYAAHGPWSRQDHGFSGEMRMETPSYTGMAREFIAGAKELGYKRVDLNGKFTEGFDTATYAMKRGHRQGTFSSFIRSIRPRWNLVVYKYSHVNRILMKERNGTQSAYGVEFDRHGKRKFAFAKKEIIVSAGAIQSAKLLMLSGIGPQDHLDSLSIPVKADLPVGKNLQDHLHTFLGPFLLKSPKSLMVDRDITSDAFIKYSSIKSRGPLTTTGIQASGMITSSRAKRNAVDKEIWPDIQLSLYGIAAHESYDKDMSHAFRLTEKMTSKYMKSAKGKDSFSILVSVARPESRGVVLLQNKDPYTDAIIDPKYYDKDSDMDVMVDGIEKALTLVENSTIFGSYGGRFTREMLPGCESYLFRSEAYWECFASHFSVSLGHVAGTVPMGGALDTELKVLGVNRLRVVDASAMPTIVGSGTQAATLVIGEKASEMIMEYWGIPDNLHLGKLNHEDFTERPEKEFTSSLIKESQGQVLIKSTHGFQIPEKMDPNYIYNNIPTSEKPSTIKTGRSTTVDPIIGNFTQSNTLSADHSTSTVPLYDYSIYFPTERRPVVHIKDRNIPQVTIPKTTTTTTTTTSRSVRPRKRVKLDPALRSMDNYFSEVTSSTTLEPEDTKVAEKQTLYPNLSPTSLYDHYTSPQTAKYSTTESPEREIEGTHYINYPYEVISHTHNNNDVLQRGTPVVVDNPTVISHEESTTQLPPVKFSKANTRKPPQNNYKYVTNQILRETMPLLALRNKDNPILQYHYREQERSPPMRYSVSPEAYGANIHTLRNNVAKFLEPDQTQKVASQNSFIFSNKPLNFNAENMKQDAEGLRSSVFKILHPNATYEYPTTPKPNPFKNIFAPFTKLLENPMMRFVKDPVKFVSDPLKFVAGHIKLVTDPLSKAVPEPFSKVIQAPINFMERIHTILNANKKNANKLPPSPYGNFGTVLTTAVEASTKNPQHQQHQGFSFKVADASIKNTNFREYLTTTTSQPQDTTNKYEFSASTPLPKKVPSESSTTPVTGFRKLPPGKFPYPFPPTTVSTTPVPPYFNNGYGEHYTSVNNTFDYNQFTTEETSSESEQSEQSQSSESSSQGDRPPKDYELVESDSTPVGKRPFAYSSNIQKEEINLPSRPPLEGNLDPNLKIIYQPPFPVTQEIPTYQVDDSVEKPNFYDFQQNFMKLKNKDKHSYEIVTPILEQSAPIKEERVQWQTIFNTQEDAAPIEEKFPEQIVKVNTDHDNNPIPEEIEKLLGNHNLGEGITISPVYSKPTTPSFPQNIDPEQWKTIFNTQEQPQITPEEESTISKYPGSQILKVNTNDNNDHLPEEVKKLLKSQNLEKDTQVYVLLSDQQNLGDNFENIPNFKEILNQFPEGTQVKSLLQSTPSPFRSRSRSTDEKSVTSSTRSVQKTITTTTSTTTEKSPRSNLVKPKKTSSYQSPRNPPPARLRATTTYSTTKKPKIIQEEAVYVSPWSSQNTKQKPKHKAVPEQIYESPWALGPTASSTDNPALSFKIQILKPKTKF